MSTTEQTPESPWIVFAGGGTGGHLYPALAVADAIAARLPRARISFFGTSRPIDAHILGETPYQLVPQPFTSAGSGPAKLVRSLRHIFEAGRACRRGFDAELPALVVGTGGISCLPAVWEARHRGVPTALLNPDAVPGRANRLLARSVDLVFVQWQHTTEAWPRATRVMCHGCPVREIFATATREAGLRRFELDPRRRTLLVTGASQGARTINQAVVANLDLLEQMENWQLLHLTGRLDFDMVAKACDASSARARVLAYTEHMHEALAAADLVVSRAGASTLAEITAVGRASILMPYPYHRDMHQLANAKSVASGGAATIVNDEREVAANARSLRDALARLMRADAHRDQMAAAARRIGSIGAATRIAQDLLDLAVEYGTIQPGAGVSRSRRADSLQGAHLTTR